MVSCSSFSAFFLSLITPVFPSDQATPAFRTAWDRAVRFQSQQRGRLLVAWSLLAEVCRGCRPVSEQSTSLPSLRLMRDKILSFVACHLTLASAAPFYI